MNLAETLHLHARWTADLTADQRSRVISDLAVQQVTAGEPICVKGEAVESWLGILHGLAKISNSAPDGRTLSFTGVPPGGWFGEGSLLKREPRRYDASALRDSLVARLPRTTFDWLLDTSIAFNRYLLIQLNERLAQFIARLEYEYLLEPEAKLARCIADLFNPILYPGSGPRLEISQAEIALLVGTSRQRANQSLQVLEKAGLVRIEYGAIRVLDLAGLQEFGP